VLSTAIVSLHSVMNGTGADSKCKLCSKRKVASLGSFRKLDSEVSPW